MALTTCRTCDGRVAVDAPVCPHCGATDPGSGAAERDETAGKQAARRRRRLRSAVATVAAVVVLGAAVWLVVRLLDSSVDSTEELAERLGCEGYNEQMTSVDDQGVERSICDVEGEPVTLIVFGDDAGRQEWVDSAARLFDTVFVLERANWVVLSPVEAAVEAAQDEVGGDVQRVDG